MHLVHRKFLGCVLAIAAGIVPAVLPAQSIAAEVDRSEEASAAAMFFDGLIVRPLMLAGTVLGIATFVVTLPFSIPAGGASNAPSFRLSAMIQTLEPILRGEA